MPLLQILIDRRENLHANFAKSNVAQEGEIGSDDVLRSLTQAS